MGSNQNLKAYVRYDGSGRVVAGSLILRRQKPKVGKWQEIPKNQCCNFDQSTITVTIENSFPFSYPDFVIQGVGGNGQYIYVYAQDGTPVGDVYELEAFLNNEYAYLGTFKVLGGSLLFTPNAAVAALFVGSGSTALQAFTFAD